MTTRPEAHAPAFFPFRPWLQRWGVSAEGMVAGLVVGHALLRFGGLWNPLYIPLSMAVVWPLPWMLSPRSARRALGFRRARAWHWYWVGPAVAVAVMGACAAAAWGLFGAGESNWFVHHARVLQEPLAQMPGDPSTLVRFVIVTGPALLFSPLAEEFLFRGYLLSVLAERWSEQAAQWGQATAFGLMHLAHYGLVPVQPALIALWVPSMIVAGRAFGWVVRRSGSVWSAVLAHAAFNASMNALVFWVLPGLVAG